MSEFWDDGEAERLRKLDWQSRLAKKPFKNGGGHAEDFLKDDTEASLICEPLAPLAIADIPPRQWAYGNFLLFGEASAIGAVDGLGKGVHAVAICLSMITGRELLREHVWRTGPVAIVSYEDKEIEWRRRIAAACLYYDIDYDAVISQFHFIRHPKRPICFAENGPNGVAFPDGDAVIHKLRAIDAVLLIVDPFNHAHTLGDGNNNALVAKSLARSRVSQMSAKLPLLCCTTYARVRLEIRMISWARPRFERHFDQSGS